MKKFVAFALASFVLYGADAQISRGNAYLQGKYVEVGINRNGGFGTDSTAPAGYHPKTPTSPVGALGFVADPEKDGWLVSVPPSPLYMGDYFVPGDPYEGWWIQAGSMPLAWGQGRDGTSGITAYGNISYSSTATQTSSVWQGMYGNLSITQTTTQKKDKLYFVMTVDIVNTGATPISNVYYMRGVDPDNEEDWTGPTGFTTKNEIVYQPTATSKNCLVTATGLAYPYMSYLGLGTKDCRAKCMIMYPWRPTSLSESYSGLGSGSTGHWRNVGYTVTADYGLGLIFNLGTLAPGQKTSLAYTYILKKEDLDSALGETAPKFAVDGVPFAPYSTFRVCPGNTVSLKVINGGQYKWIWTPSTDMNPVAGTDIVSSGGTIPTITGAYTYPDGGALGDSISVNVFGPREYRATGISNCDTQILVFYVDTISFSVPPAVTSPVRYCEGVSASALSAGTATGATLRWYQDPASTTYTTAPPTPATNFPPGSDADYDTTSYYVSQINATGCETPRSKIDVIITRKPAAPAVKALVYCKGSAANQLSAAGENLKWYDASTAGTRYTSTPTPATVTTGLVTYYVSQTVNGCEGDRAALGVEVSSIVAQFNMLKDSICGTGVNMYYNKSVNTALLDSNYSSVWHFGDNTPDDTFKDANHTFQEGQAMYSVKLKVTNVYGCSDSVEHKVWTFPQPVLSIAASDTLICQGQTINFEGTITPGSTGVTWDFSNNAQAHNTLTVTHGFANAGRFDVKLLGGYPACPDANAVRPVTVTAIPVVNIGPDTTICVGGSPIILSNRYGYTAGAHYLWSTGDTTTAITITHEGEYWLRINTGDCTASDSITVTKSCYLDVPNAFTPGAGDDANSYFLPRQLLSKAVITFDMKIFDRWGQLVFESTKTDGRGWNGNFNGKPMPMGVYVYMIKASFSNGITESYQGNLTLIR